MKNNLTLLAVVFASLLALPRPALALTEGSIGGTVVDDQEVAVSNAQVELLSPDGKLIKTATSSTTGEFNLFPIVFGDYRIKVVVKGFAPYDSSVHVASGSQTQLTLRLTPEKAGKEMVMTVRAKKHLIQSSASVSSAEITKEDIAHMPFGEEISLPRLLTTTTPGVVAGSFGQMFFRGNHANIQYQIDGVQLPDSPSNTFGQAFSPRNIDHMEVITGGIPAEYGYRLSAVNNIVTKSGPENPGGEVEVNYGSYNTFSPHIIYGGSNAAGDVHYFLSANYNRTDRGLDTPNPVSETNLTQGGPDVVHDSANGNSEFAKVDWLPNNIDKFTLIVFNDQEFRQIPNYPASFSPTDNFFSSTFVDPTFATSAYIYTPATTNDTQYEVNSYAELVWKHTFSDRQFMQLAPYYKYSLEHFQNDPVNDLFTSPSGPVPLGNPLGSFYENRHVNNFGVKFDYSDRFDDHNLFKTGIQLQESQSLGLISVQTDLASPVQYDSSPDTGLFESFYAQDDYTITKQLTLNIGVRFDATQFTFSGVQPTDWMVQPRIGLNYMINDITKYHVFYGRLFQPAPVENLRDTFVNTGAGQLAPFDIKAEKDDYFEMGIARQVGDSHAGMINVYYKSAINMLDDTQLLNTSIAQPYNFAQGYAYGIEFSWKGDLDNTWSDFFNYAFEIAKGKGTSGGIFTLPPGTVPDPGFQFLDHVQEHTANFGLTYSKHDMWATTQGQFGSGLRTGPGNSLSLPDHFTLDFTLGYQFKGESWWEKFKISGDVLNIFNNRYPITLNNGYNGSHFAAGREFFIRLNKEI